jgi:transposase
MKKFSKPRRQREEDADLRAENARLKRELKRAEQERNILKEAAVFFAGESKNGTRL